MTESEKTTLLTVKHEIDSDSEANDPNYKHVTDRRTLRTRYLAVKNLIFDERDDLSSIDSAKFKSIVNDLESLHQFVLKPREQIADAEALLDITNTLLTSVKATNGDGITISDFVDSLVRDFAKQSSRPDGRTLIDWKKIGIEYSDASRSSRGCRTMIGPMDTQMKQRKARRKRARLVENEQPAEVDDTDIKKKTNTDINMAAMFDILRKHRIVRLEQLVLNRNSFAQTVENIFALSFLVKDGRADIKLDEKGIHLVSPKNAPTATAIASKEVVYNHFVFRFDFKDWKLMKDYIEVGHELMPHRD
ncbi:Non-structural maintenance of chromosome element 4 [Gossypium arboreum]|uniref:Non-structural maintenance of chromosomes element 4 n=2 Tax=Gossypium arboreum TaxID=29729 RepID=A0A0B0MIT2_GOSAR|nr:non-structural maintenance of chromosomes element 4 homolog A-like isoform X1 [Gossypium arboreum]XP_052881255.1 non-structural maintenance of chromosomes element 4 homolog A-like isoform X1 [Gossypium arboreum]KAK5844049.1 hypothetical protein PVK06_000184 [Gossypium arboreum]KHF99343.1 Non-structural maintenance of chromosome element 4 [Gossypium arboreum]